MDDATLDRLAELAVRFGSNVQPGQIVAIGGDIGKEEVMRALAESAYRHGAKFVDAAYFDLHMKRARLTYAAEDTLDWAHIEQCRTVGVKRFTDSLAQVMARLDGMIPEGANVFFAHTMAGGIPKAKVFLAIANRVYKGRGERFMSSQTLLDSDLGKLILKNFDEVSANTFQHLIDASAAIRARVQAAGGEVRYSAYGYHGTEILIGPPLS